MPTHLDPSPLGTKEYWQKIYTTDLENHATNAVDIGTVWFSDSSAEEKVLDYLSAKASSLGLDVSNSTVLDLGCGNGSMLFTLREEGWTGQMVGVDYAAESIELARRLAEEKNLHKGDEVVRFELWDVMQDAFPTTDPNGWLPEGGFDVVLDKGTFDAISLNAEVDEGGRRLCEGYRERVECLVGKGGLVLVTSCNWTEEELQTWFGDGELEFAGKVKYPSFSFGGRKGQTISSVCFKRRI